MFWMQTTRRTNYGNLGLGLSQHCGITREGWYTETLGANACAIGEFVGNGDKTQFRTVANGLEMAFAYSAATDQNDAKHSLGALRFSRRRHTAGARNRQTRRRTLSRESLLRLSCRNASDSNVARRGPSV